MSLFDVVLQKLVSMDAVKIGNILTSIFMMDKMVVKKLF